MLKYVYRVNNVYVLTDFEIPGEKQVDLPYDLNEDLNVWTSYIRWSHTSQTDRYSFKTQFSKMIAFADSKSIDIVVLFVDQAKSAYKIPANKRKAMLEMKDYIINKQNISGLIMIDESRLTRSIEDFQLLILNPIKEAKPHFTVFSSATGDRWDENDIYTQVKLALVHEESAKKADYSNQYQDTLLKQQERPGSKYPYGYSKVDDELVENRHAPVVMLIFHLYSFGYSEKTIAQLLNAADTPTSKGKFWSDSTVRYILNNEWYIGNLTWHRRTGYHNSKQKAVSEATGTLIAKNHHSPLIGHNLWSITQYMRQHKITKDRMNSPYILRGLLKCKTCNIPMSTKNMTGGGSQKQTLVYRCSNCKRNINIEFIHEHVLNNYTRHWSKGLLEYKKSLKLLFKRWNKAIESKLRENDKLLTQLTYRKQMVQSKADLSPEIIEAFDMSIADIENQKMKLYYAKEKIQLLQEDVKQTELLERFSEDIFKFSTEEQKSLLLLSINDILVELTSPKTEIIINYRLTPYIDLEEFLESPDQIS